MRKGTEKQREDRGKTGDGARATGVFKRVADAERKSGEKKIRRDTIADSK